MYNGSLPPATVYGTWVENIEIWDTVDDTLMDLSSVTEITLKLIDPVSMFDELTLTMSGGDITIPSTGIVQWRVEADRMATLTAQLYNAVLLFEDGDDTVPLFIGPVSIIE